MKINNNSIRGFFIYSSSAEYEYGDFVIYGNTIYVCSPKEGSTTVIGEKPYESENFYVYLGDQLADVKEFQEFSENNGGEDKYISLSTLVSILNTYLTGINNSGIIGHEFTKSDNGEVIYRVNNVISEVYGAEENQNILAKLLLNESINHGIFKVSKNLPELKTFVGENGDYCILRQYSYYSDEEKKTLIRVQELIDIEFDQSSNTSYANIYYRSAPITNTISQITNLNFLSATAHSSCLARQASNLVSLYSTRMRLFEEKIESLKKNFCFSEIYINKNQSEITLQNERKSYTGYIDVDDISEFGPITLNILTNENPNDSNEVIYKSHSITIEPRLGSCRYYIEDDLWVNFSLNNKAIDEKDELTLQILNNTNNQLSLGLGDYDDDALVFPKIYQEIDISSQNYSIITIDKSILENNLILGTSTINSQTPIILNYKVGSESKTRTFIYKNDGSIEPVSIGGNNYSYFDFDEIPNVSVDDRKKYLLSNKDLSNLSNNTKIVFYSVNSYNLKISNQTDFSLYFPSLSINAGSSDENFKIVTGAEKEFPRAIIPSLPSRGFYLYSKEITEIEESSLGNLLLKLSIQVYKYEDEEKMITTPLLEEEISCEAVGNIYQEKCCIWGSYSEPIISFEEMLRNVDLSSNSNLLIAVNCKVEINNDNDAGEENPEEQQIALMSYNTEPVVTTSTSSSTSTSSTSTTTSTVVPPSESVTFLTTTASPDSITTTPSTSSSYTLKISRPGDNTSTINQAKISVISEEKKKNPIISSAYFRKYFNPT